MHIIGAGGLSLLLGQMVQGIGQLRRRRPAQELGEELLLLFGRLIQQNHRVLKVGQIRDNLCVVRDLRQARKSTFLPGPVVQECNDIEFREEPAFRRFAHAEGGIVAHFLLRKEQFMQVGMIAQGEFMELLRAKSADKKEIYRRLFGTELYQQIGDELDRRKKEKEKELGHIRTVCQTEASHIVIPDNYENAEEVRELIKRIMEADRLNVANMDSLIEVLKILTDYLTGEKSRSDAELVAAVKERDEKRDIYTRTENLLKSFRQQDEAEKQLAECAANEAHIKELERLGVQLAAAYEVQAVYTRYEDAIKTLAETMRRLEQQKALMPGLEEKVKKANAELERTRKVLEEEQDNAIKVKTRVE